MNFRFKQPEDSPGFLLWQLTNQWQRAQRNALAKLELTHAQFVVLASVLWLSSQPDNIVTQQQISAHSKIDKMSMSALTKTLVQKKLLVRTAHANDGRAYSLALTEKGHKLVLKAIPIVERIDADFFTKDTTQLVQLVHNLKHLIHN